MQNPTHTSRFRQFINAGGGFLLIIICCLAVVLMIASLIGCKHVEYVTVPEVHTEYHHTSDTVRQVDSIIDRQTTVVREVDSATMAQYGIQLANAQRAWLIQNDRLMREIERLREKKADSVFIHDSIAVPYPVEKIVEKPYTPKLVQVLAWVGGILIISVLGWVGIKIYKKFHTI